MSGLELAFVPLSGRPGLRQAWPLGAAPSARPEVAQRFSAGTSEPQSFFRTDFPGQR